MRSNRTKLPLKVVPALEEDYYRPDYGGSDPKVFVDVTPDVRGNIAENVVAVRRHFAEAFRKYPGVPAVAKVTIRPQAMAKTHHPTKLLSPRTCPVIGMSDLCEMLVTATPQGLDQLARFVESDTTKLGVANISTVESIVPYVPIIEPPGEASVATKVKLFLHRDEALDAAVLSSFLEIAQRIGITDAREIRYGKGMRVFRFEAGTTERISEFEDFLGIQSVSEFPIYHPVRTHSVAVRDLMPDDFPPPDPDEEYPVIGVVDSGVSASVNALRPWVVGREEYVPRPFQDNNHGSFVAGLIARGQRLNHGDERFPSCSARVLDVVALGNDGITEDVLLTRLEDAISKHPEIEVWNLSLGTRKPIVNNAFSDFAIALDRLQDEYGISFVLAAGNYVDTPLRGWPPNVTGDVDRICAPADSTRSIVVGSVAHLDHAGACVRSGDPSPFSRKGPGPLYLPKPELSHIGGNCNSAGSHNQIGVLSVDANGKVAEDIGTSFATPLIASLRANVSKRIHGGASRILSRALLVHSAALRGGKIDCELLHYRGFGVPDDVDGILGCESWECTLIFELTIKPNVSFEKALFPMPSCLYVADDMVRANVLMTLVYEPELDASFGTEYCRTNIEVSLGTHDVGSDGKPHQHKQVHEDPKLTGGAYEEDLIKHGFKWSPVKVYRREMVRGVRAKQWRLDLSVHHRSGHTPTAEQEAALIITVSDPKKIQPVYNEMVNQMNLLGWAATDLQLRPRVRS